MQVELYMWRQNKRKQQDKNINYLTNLIESQMYGEAKDWDTK